MSTINLKNLPIKFRHMTYRPSDNFVEVDAVNIRYEVDKDTKTKTDEIEGYNVDFISIKGQIQTCKLPNTPAVKEAFVRIEDALNQNQVVKVHFGNPSTFLGKIYEIVDGNRIISGISATATTLEIVDIDSTIDDEFIEL